MDRQRKHPGPPHGLLPPDRETGASILVGGGTCDRLSKKLEIVLGVGRDLSRKLCPGRSHGEARERLM